MLKVNGVEVRIQEVKVDFEVKFSELTEDGQKRVFLENKEDFIVEALKSNYPAVQELVWQVKNGCSSVALNKAIEECIRRGASVNRILDLLEVPGLELEEELREILSCFVDDSIKLWVAKDPRTPFELLKSDQMFSLAVSEMVHDRGTELFDRIVANPNFKENEDIDRLIKEFSSNQEKEVRARMKEITK